MRENKKKENKEVFMCSLKHTFMCLVIASLVLTSIGCEGEPEVPVVVLDSDFGQGNFSIIGTVELPDNASAGRYIQLQVNECSLSNFVEIVVDTKTTGTSSIDYEINNLSNGKYKVFVCVDETGNSIMNDSGDFAGFYDGTLQNPILEIDSAAYIRLSGSSLEDVNFGLGEVP